MGRTNPAGGGTASVGVQAGLFAAIAAGSYGPGARLPPERDLAVQYGVGRVSVREALQRLALWNVISVRQGSGATVRARREWTIDVLPDYLRYQMREGNRDEALGLLEQLLAFRRTALASALAGAAGRPIDPAGLEAARVAVRRGWESRSDFAAYLAHEIEMIRSLLEAARALPGMWILNKLAGIYLELALAIPAEIPVPADHLSSKLAFIDAVEEGKLDKAWKILSRHLADHDAKLLALLGHKPRRS